MPFPKLLRALRPMNGPTQLLTALAVSLAAAGAAEAAECQSIVQPIPGSTYEVTVDTSATVRKLQPEFFSFNLEWLEFQWSLWDSANRRVKPDVVQYLRAFPGAAYRYPGGTVANYFEWKNASGDIALRKAQRPVDWNPPLVVEFGLEEYLNFVRAVGGRPWYVLNLYGSLSGERPPADMAREAGELAAFMHHESVAGLPAVFRWELGNELDRGNYLWRPEKYAAVAGTVLSALVAADPSAQAVSLAEDYDALWQSGITTTAYDVYLGTAFKGRVREFADHLYYDGAPWGDTIPGRVQQMCRNISNIGAGLLSPPDIWVTEHSRTPSGTADDPNWQKNWPQTANLAAAISVDDMLIALSQIPEVKGAFTHALHGTTGPWPMFHLNTAGGVVPSAVYWGMRMLRETMLEGVLATRVVSANQSGYEGGYDLRGVALANELHNQFSVWLANRAKAPVRIKLTMPALARNTVYSDVSVLGSTDPAINNYGGISRISPRKTSLRLVFDGGGQTFLDVPANSVMTLSLSKTVAAPMATTRTRTPREKQ